jgi:hypothetical protein
MEIWFSDHSPVPGWEFCLASPVGFIICGTDFDFFTRGYEPCNQSEDILIIESLDIEYYIALSREDEILYLRSRIEWRHHDMTRDMRYILVSHMRRVSSEYLFEESEGDDITPDIDIFSILGVE